MSQIVVMLDVFGRINTIEVNGVQGTTCTNLTASIEQVVTSASTKSKTTTKPEYYESSTGGVVESEKVKW